MASSPPAAVTGSARSARSARWARSSLARVLAVGVASVLTLAACRGDAGPGAGGAEITDSAGVVVVTNRGDAPSEFRAESPVRIGAGGLDAPEAYLFQLISDVVVAPDGRVVVIDNRAGRIAVFGPDGEWHRDIGRRGRGPGEHEAPIRASMIGDTVYVWDALLRRLNSYDVDGAFIAQLPLPERSAGLPIRAVPGGYIDEEEWGQYMDPEPAAGALLRRDRDGAVLDTLAGPYPVPEVGWEWVVEGQRGMMVNPPAFSVRPAWSAHGAAVVRVRPLTATLEVLDAGTGRLERIIHLDRPVRTPTAADRDAYVDAYVALRDLSPRQRTGMLERTDWAERIPPVTAVVMDDEGRIWVAEHDPGQRPGRQHVASRWDVLDPDGRRIGRVVFPDDFELRSVRGGRAYGVSTDADGVETVAVYEVSFLT